METHEQDPRSEDETDPWTTFHLEWGELRDRIKNTYLSVASEDGPSETEIKAALGTLSGAWDQMAGSVSSALQDPGVRRALKDAGGALASALGRTITDLGAELANDEHREGHEDAAEDI